MSTLLNTGPLKVHEVQMYTIIVISLVYILYKCLVLTGTDGRCVPVVNAPAECWPDPLVQLDWIGRPQVILCAILSYPLPPLWWAGTHSWRERRIHHLHAPHTGLVKKSTNMLTPVLLSQGTGMRFQHYSNGVG